MESQQNNAMDVEQTENNQSQNTQQPGKEDQNLTQNQVIIVDSQESEEEISQVSQPENQFQQVHEESMKIYQQNKVTPAKRPRETLKNQNDFENQDQLHKKVKEDEQDLWKNQQIIRHITKFLKKREICQLQRVNFFLNRFVYQFRKLKIQTYSSLESYNKEKMQ